MRIRLCRRFLPKDRLLDVSCSSRAAKDALTHRPFVILIITTLFLLATLGGSVALLYSVGDTKLPSTLNLAIGNPKRD